MRRLCAWIIGHPWWVLAGAALITVGLILPLFGLETDVDFKNYVDQEDEAYVLTERAEELYGSQRLIMVAIINSEGIFQADTLAKIARLEEALSEISGVKEVDGPISRDIIVSSESAIEVGPAAPGGVAPSTSEEIAAYRERVVSIETMRGLLISEDETAAAIFVEMETGASEYDVSDAIRQVVNKIGTPPERFSISGEPYLMLTLTESIQGDSVFLIPLVIVAMCLVLFLSFRSLRGVALPLLVVALSVIWTFGPMGLFGVKVSIITFVLPVLLLAIGIAYGIHVLSRYHEELLGGKPKREALLDATTEISGAVAMAGLTTMGGFLSLLTADLPMIREFGILAAAGVALAMICALVVLPALLAVLPVPKTRTRQRTQADGGLLARVLASMSGTVARHPRVFFVGLLIALVALSAMIPLLRTDSSMTAFLGDTHPAVVGMNDIDEYLSGSEQLMIEIDTGTADGLKDPALLEEIIDIEEYLTTLGVRKTMSITDLVRELNLRFHADDPAYYAIPEDRKQVSQLLFLYSFQGGDLGTVALADYSAGEVVGFYSTADGETRAKLVRQVRVYLAEHFTGDVTAKMVGSTQFFDSMGRQLINSQIRSLVTSAIVAALIVSLLMGSLVAGLISIIPLTLTILGSFAAMAITGTTLNIATAVIASVTIGIGIDYAVHFLSRYRSEFLRSRASVTAARTTAVTAGRAIVFNAAAVLAGFIVLLASDFMALRSFGWLLALAMAVSACAALTAIPAVLARVRPRFLDGPAWSGMRKRFNDRKTEQGG